MNFRSRHYLTSFATINILAISVLTFTRIGMAQTFANVQAMQGWETCSTCAGRGGTGPATPHSIRYGVLSPSLDGSSTQFTNSGTVPYSDALWWHQLGGNPNASHFVYDLYFYVDNAGASQALEFDVNQSTGGRKYIWGTQCGVSSDHQWSVWGGGSWHPTGIGCSVNASSWNHVTIEVSRSNGNANFIAVTLNGRKSYINRSYGSIGSGVEEINTAFQMDQTGAHVPYSVWLDRVSLNY